MHLFYIYTAARVFFLLKQQTKVLKVIVFNHCIADVDYNVKDALTNISCFWSISINWRQLVFTMHYDRSSLHVFIIENSLINLNQITHSLMMEHILLFFATDNIILKKKSLLFSPKPSDNYNYNQIS